MNYVEWLRIRNTLRIVAIVLGALIVVAIIVRISLAGSLGHEQAFIDRVSQEPGSKVMHFVVNGADRTIIVNKAKRLSITVDNLPGERAITVREPSKTSDVTGIDLDHTTFGSVGFTTSSAGGVTTTVMTVETALVPFRVYFHLAAILGLIVATILGATFARESNGHLEIAMLKPVSRTRFALGQIGVDLAGIAIAEVMTIVAALIMQSLFYTPGFAFSGADLPYILTALLLPFTWYLMLNAFTASLKQGSGTVIGFAWPAALVVIFMEKLDLGSSAAGQAFHDIFWILSRILPLTYISLNLDDHAAMISTDAWNLPVQMLVLSILMLVYGALAIVQWRRVEA
jgi:hypothetical protein